MIHLPIILFVLTVVVLWGLTIYLTVLRSEMKWKIARELADRIAGHDDGTYFEQTLRSLALSLSSLFNNPRPLMQILVSVSILGAALVVIVSNRYAPQDKNWAYGSLGTILGYWLKSK